MFAATRHTGSLWEAASVSPDDQVDDAEVEDLLVGVVVGDLLLLFLDLPHQLFSLLERRNRFTLCSCHERAFMSRHIKPLKHFYRKKVHIEEVQLKYRVELK